LGDENIYTFFIKNFFTFFLTLYIGQNLDQAQLATFNNFGVSIMTQRSCFKQINDWLQRQCLVSVLGLEITMAEQNVFYPITRDFSRWFSYARM